MHVLAHTSSTGRKKRCFYKIYLTGQSLEKGCFPTTQIVASFGAPVDDSKSSRKVESKGRLYFGAKKNSGTVLYSGGNFVMWNNYDLKCTK